LEDNTLPAEQEEYKIYIGDGAGTRSQTEMNSGNIPITDLFITRNTHYDVSANIKSFSRTNESLIDVITKVIVWDRVLIDDTDIGTNELKVSQDEFHMSSNDFEGAVMIDTNHPNGWSVATTPPSGGVKSLTVSNDGTIYTSTLSNQTGTLLRFKGTGWSSTTDVGYIDVIAGPIVKRINVSRH
jgi:hypothetical protein